MNLKKTIAIMALFSLFTPYSHLFGAYDDSSAQNYLSQNASNPWSTMGLVALDSSSVPTDYLKSVTPTTAIAAAAPILAITAIGGDPRIFGNSDLVAGLRATAKNAQIGDINTLNDDMFGILALISAGEDANDSVIQDAKKYISQNQNSDGGWGFAPNAPSDTNMTSAGILALLAAKVSSSDSVIQNALDYLANSQNNDGGFPYDPESQFDTASDSSSTAWVIWALNALNINPSSWNKSQGDPITYLESLQNSAGYFGYQTAEEDANSFSPHTTAYAAIALSGKTLPLAIIDNSPRAYSFVIEGSSGIICEGMTDGPNALDIVKNASVDCGFNYVIEDTDYGPYLSQIENDAAEGMAGWMYFINLEAPSVGAADYILNPGDQILWKFAGFGWSPISQGIELKAVYESGSVGGVNTGPEDDVIGFTVTPDVLDFGALSAGGHGAGVINISNTGNINLYLESIVSGDKIFRELLEIDKKSWPEFVAELPRNNNRDYTVEISVPNNFSDSSGQKTGQLTFWATAE